jgi:hypothetical protein
MLDKSAEKKISNEGWGLGFLAFITAAIAIRSLDHVFPPHGIWDVLGILLNVTSLFAFCIVFLVHDRYIIWRRRYLCGKRSHEYGAIETDEKHRKYMMCTCCGYYNFLEE